MSITIDDVTNPGLVTTNLAHTNAAGAVDELAALLEADGRVTDRAAFVAAVLAREEETGGTGMESGIAIPHAKSPAVARPSVAFGRSTSGIDFGADDARADLVFLIAAPQGDDDFHVTLLSRLARRLIHQQFRTALREAGTAEDIVGVIKREVEL